MKHQTFRNSVYVEINTCRDHLTVIGQVKDSTITINRIPYERLFNIPQESIELHPKLLIIYENPEQSPEFIDDILFIEDLLYDLDSLVVRNGKLFASVLDITLPAEEIKTMFYKLNQRAK